MTTIYGPPTEDFQGEPVPQDLVVRTALRDTKEITRRHYFKQNFKAHENLGWLMYRGDVDLTDQNTGLSLNEIVLRRVSRDYLPDANLVVNPRTKKTTRTGIDGHTKRAEFPLCTSAFQGMPVKLPRGVTTADFKNLDKEERKAIFRLGWEYAGIVGTHRDADWYSKDMGLIMFSLRTKGVIRLTNTGVDIIEQGNRIMWDFLDTEKGEERQVIMGTDLPGGPVGKVLAAVVSVTPEAILSTEVLKANAGKKKDIIQSKAFDKNFQMRTSALVGAGYDEVLIAILQAMVSFKVASTSSAENYGANLRTEGAKVKNLESLFPSKAYLAKIPNEGDQRFCANATRRMVNSIIRVVLDAREREIGIAQTTACPGERFDAYVF